MQSILKQASKAAHQAILNQPAKDTQRYSQFPVHASEFWEALYSAARDPKQAQQALDAMQLIMDEPCIENDRVWRNVVQVRNLAQQSLLH
jgi:hypothetical protein